MCIHECIFVRKRSTRKKTWVCIRCAWVTIALFHLCNLSLFLSSSSNVPDDNVSVCHEFFSPLPSFTTFSPALSLSFFFFTLPLVASLSMALSSSPSSRWSNDKFQVKRTLDDCKRFTLDWMRDHLTMRVEWKRKATMKSSRKEQQEERSREWSKWCEWILLLILFHSSLDCIFIKRAGWRGKHVNTYIDMTNIDDGHWWRAREEEEGREEEESESRAEHFLFPSDKHVYLGKRQASIEPNVVQWPFI